MPSVFNRDVLAGSTGVRTVCKLIKTADGTEDTGLIAADLTASYFLLGADATVPVTLSDATGLDDAHSAGKVKEVSDGRYLVHWPDAIFTSGAAWALVRLESDDSFYDELIRIGTAEVVLSPQTHTGAVIPTVTTLTGHTAQTGDSFARIGATGSGLTSLAQSSTALDAAGVRTAVGLASANIDAQIAALPTASANAAATWDEARSGHVTAGTFGELLQPYDALCQSGSTGSTIVLAADAASTNDYYNGQQVSITAGTGAGQSARITDYVGSTRTANIVTESGSWAVTPDNTSGYVLGGIAPGGAVASVAGNVGGNVVGSVASVTAGVALSATGLDAIPATEPAGPATTFRGMIVQSWMRWFRPASLTTTHLKTFAADGTTWAVRPSPTPLISACLPSSVLSSVSPALCDHVLK